MHILVILTDITYFAEAMREVSSSKERFRAVKDIRDIYTVNLLLSTNVQESSERKSRKFCHTDSDPDHAKR